MQVRTGRFLRFLLLLMIGGCPTSPEADRSRGAGHGGDGGNYVSTPIHAPSKIDGTRDLEKLK